jgi:hypothetical protein
MRRMRALMGGVAVALMLLGPACGGDDKTTAPEAANGSGAPDLDQFLMRAGEEPGFRPVGRADTLKGVTAFAEDLRLTQADARRLRGEGFISFVVKRIRGPRTEGVTNVALYATAKGAEHSMAHELRPSVIRLPGPVAKLRYFTVPGIPGARGWTASKPHVGNLHWVQGRCFFVLGNQGPGPFEGPLSKGARAIYERTNGECP